MLHCDDIDDLMVEWLYGELELARATEVSGHVDDCARCQTEKAAFSRTREVFAALPDAEPPSSLTAMLVREAALSAKTPRKAAVAAPESGGFGAWLTGLFRPLMHPAAAAIATLVVVVAVGGTLYINKGSDQLARPTTPGVALDSAGLSDTAADKAAASTPADEPNADESEASLQAGEAMPSALAKSALGGADLDGATDQNELTRNTRTAALLEKSRDDKLREQTKKQRQKRARVAKAPKAPKAANADPKRRIADSSKDDFASSFADLEEDSDKSKEGFGYAGNKAGKKAGEKAGWVQGKEAQLLTAFKKDDCKSAASIANDIRDRNPTYYKANTADLDAVKKCQYYVTSERKRRTSVARKRAKKANKSKAKKSTGSKANTSKAAAAEALDDTAADSKSGL